MIRVSCKFFEINTKVFNKITDMYYVANEMLQSQLRRSCNQPFNPEVNNLTGLVEASYVRKVGLVRDGARLIG